MEMIRTFGCFSALAKDRLRPRARTGRSREIMIWRGIIDTRPGPPIINLRHAAFGLGAVMICLCHKFGILRQYSLVKVFWIMFLSCVVLSAAEKPSLRNQIQDAVENETSMVFGQNHVKRIVRFELMTRERYAEAEIEPLGIYISDNVRLSDSDEAVDLRMLRQALKFYREGCKAAGEKPLVYVILRLEVDDDLVRRAINVLTEPGQNEVLIGFEVRQSHPPKPIITKKPTQPKRRLFYGCLVYNCQVCGNHAPFTPVSDFPGSNFDPLDVAPITDFGSPDFGQPKDVEDP